MRAAMCVLALWRQRCNRVLAVAGAGIRCPSHSLLLNPSPPRPPALVQTLAELRARADAGACRFPKLLYTVPTGQNPTGGSCCCCCCCVYLCSVSSRSQRLALHVLLLYGGRIQAARCKQSVACPLDNERRCSAMQAARSPLSAGRRCTAWPSGTAY